MITPEDVNFMKIARDDMYAGRTRRVTMTSRTETGKDPYSNQPVFREVNHVIMAVVTEIKGEVQERRMVEGVVLKDGDITVDVQMEQLSEHKSDYIYVYYESEKYLITAADTKGIGERNRVEFVGRVVK